CTQTARIPYIDCSFLRIGIFFNDLNCVTYPIHHLLHMRQKYMADRGQTNSTPFAYEQRNTEFFFQIDNLSADRRLRNMQMVCSICHMLTPGSFDEICYLPQFHSNHLTPIIAYRHWLYLIFILFRLIAYVKISSINLFTLKQVVHPASS